MTTLPQFYVYVLARPNGKPFYVGKGKGKRIYNHDTEARSGHNCHKCNVIRKIWKRGGQVQRYFVFTTNDEQAALAYEIELIALYGRHTLCNLTDGGESPSPTEETRAKMRRVYERRSPEERAAHRQKLSDAHKGLPYSEEKRLKQIGRALGPCSEERKQRISVANKGRPRTQEWNRNSSKSHRKGQTFTMIAPDGTVYEDIDSIMAFAKEHGLNGGTVHNILHGKYKNRAGWRGFIVKGGA